MKPARPPANDDVDLLECLLCGLSFPTPIHTLKHMADEHPGWDRPGYLEKHPPRVVKARRKP